MISKAVQFMRLPSSLNSSFRAFVRDLESTTVHKVDARYPKLSNIQMFKRLNELDSEFCNCWTSSLKSSFFYLFVLKGSLSLVTVAKPAVVYGSAYISSPYQSDANIISNVKVSNFFWDWIIAFAPESRDQRIQDERYPELLSSENLNYAGASDGAEESDQHEANDGADSVNHDSENLTEKKSRDEHSPRTPAGKQEGTETPTGQGRASIIMQALTEASQPR